jgi:uncharacterized membrane protein
MKPLVVLVISFLLSLVIIELIAKQWNFILAGNIAMCIMLCFTSIGHFAFTKGMQMMMPQFIPFKKELVYITGGIEVVAGISLLFSQFRYAASIFLIIFFILLLPANINAAIRHIDYEKADFNGSGVNYLWFRIPLQILFIAWVWYFGIKD